MKGSLFAAALLSSLGPAQPASARADRLHYSLGGLISGAIDLDLRLDSGDFALKELPRSAGSGTAVEHRGRVSPSSIAHIRILAAAAVRNGLTRRACRRAAARGEILMPIMDAVPAMTISLGRRVTDAPGRPDCWTDAAGKLAEAALDAARRASRQRSIEGRR